MKPLFTILTFIVLCIAHLNAHTEGDFYEHCDNIPLPSLTGIEKWNALTSTDNALYVVGKQNIVFIYYFNNGAITSLTPTSTGDTLKGVQFINNNIGYIWGINGTLIKTSNGGIDWVALSLNTSSDIKKVEFITESVGYYLAENKIYKTTNGGADWSQITLPNGTSCEDFHFFNSNNGQFCGNDNTDGYIHTTNNGGDTWTELYTDTVQFKKLMYPEENKGFIYGNTSSNPLLLKTEDKGATWLLEYTSNNWSLSSDVVSYNNTINFISNETTGEFLYGNSLFLNNPDGLVENGRNLHVANQNGEEVLYIVAARGLFRHYRGKTICQSLSFIVPNVTADSANIYNIMDTVVPIKLKPITYNPSVSDTLKNITCKLSCNDPFVEIKEANSSYGRIPPLTSKFSDSELEIQLKSTIPQGHIIHLEFEYFNTDDETSYIGKSTYELPIILAPFEINSVEVADTTADQAIGNDNGIFEPLETASIIPLVSKNTPHSFTNNIKGTLRSPYNEVYIWNTGTHPNGLIDQYDYHDYGNLEGQNQGSFAITNNFDTVYKIPLSMTFIGRLSSYKDNNDLAYKANNIEYNWITSFYVNEFEVVAPDSLLPNYKPIVDEDTSEVLSIMSNTNVSAYKLYPNPNKGQFTISKKYGEETLKPTLTIINLLGQEMKTLEINEGSKIDVSYLKKGIYFIVIKDKTQGESQTIKMIKTD